jgi:hypothetical protein
MFDVNSMIQSLDINAEQLDAWTKYASENNSFYSKSASSTSFFGMSSSAGMLGAGGDLNEDAIRDIIIKFLDLPRPIMQESLAQCLLMEGKKKNENIV